MAVHTTGLDPRSRCQTTDTAQAITRTLRITNPAVPRTANAAAIAASLSHSWFTQGLSCVNEYGSTDGRVRFCRKSSPKRTWPQRSGSVPVAERRIKASADHGSQICHRNSTGLSDPLLGSGCRGLCDGSERESQAAKRFIGLKVLGNMDY